jgi:hypothetical protein
MFPPSPVQMREGEDEYGDDVRGMQEEEEEEVDEGLEVEGWGGRARPLSSGRVMHDGSLNLVRLGVSVNGAEPIAGGRGGEGGGDESGAGGAGGAGGEEARGHSSSSASASSSSIEPGLAALLKTMEGRVIAHVDMVRLVSLPMKERE